MGEFLCIKVRSADPFERGMQYGAQARNLIHLGVQGYQRHFAKTLSTPWEEILERSHLYLELLERDFPAELAEARGIAAGSGVDLDAIMALNCRYEILKLRNLPQEKECTSGAVLPEATRGGGTFLIKNWDYRPWVENHAVIVDIDDLSGNHIVGLTEAGQLIREGFNSNGVGLCNNMIESIYDTFGTGIPVTFLRRRVLASRTFEEAYGWLIHSKRCVSNNMLLVDGRRGRAVDIEARPGGADVLRPVDGILTHANHFVASPQLDRLTQRPKNRDNRLEYLLRRSRGSIGVDTIRECMKDHEYYPQAICNHDNDPEKDPMSGLMTVASLICDFRENTAYICKGNPCKGAYYPYTL